MGWTGYHAGYYKNGIVDRKAECDAYWEEGLDKGNFKVEKSCMVGSVYYAAVTKKVKAVGETEQGRTIYVPIPEEEQITFGAVFLTSVNMKDYFNFYYKDMTEDMGPYCCECPLSILKLLSPTDNENALAWRERCVENAKKKRDKNALTNLPVGTVISFVCDFDNNACIKGTKVELTKVKRALRSRSYWYGLGYRWQRSVIPDNYTVVKRGK